jgi:NAD+ kinase
MTSRRRVAVLSKRTSYGTFVEDGGEPRVADLLRAGDPTVRRMRRSHEDHLETQREVRAALRELGVKADFYAGSRTRIEGSHDLVVTVGGDGTVLAASHQLGPDVPLLGVNSAPESSVGFFCAAYKGTVRETLERAIAGDLPGVTLTRMRVELNDRLLHNRVLNEALFCHASPAATSRYILRLVRGEKIEEEEQKSSGLWIGPAAGSTAAQRSAGGGVLPLTSEKIQFVVREPYHGAGDGTQALTVGIVGENERLELWSKMRTAKLFLDGHHDEHDVGIGDRVTMQRSNETLTILGLSRNGDKPKAPTPPRSRPRSVDERSKPRAPKSGAATSSGTRRGVAPEH